MNFKTVVPSQPRTSEEIYRDGMGLGGAIISCIIGVASMAIFDTATTRRVEGYTVSHFSRTIEKTDGPTTTYWRDTDFDGTYDEKHMIVKPLYERSLIPKTPVHKQLQFTEADLILTNRLSHQ